jgi:hypothetical protein
MKNKPDQDNNNRNRDDSNTPKGMWRIYSDGEPAEIRSGLNIWLTESFGKGAPEAVYIDDMTVQLMKRYGTVI